MRSSVEGLNQEIEKLVLLPSQPHSCRPESSHVSRPNEVSLQLFCQLFTNNYSQITRGIPEGRRAPLGDILHNDTRSVNTQTPILDFLSSGDLGSIFPLNYSKTIWLIAKFHNRREPEYIARWECIFGGITTHQPIPCTTATGRLRKGMCNEILPNTTELIVCDAFRCAWNRVMPTTHRYHLPYLSRQLVSSCGHRWDQHSNHFNQYNREPPSMTTLMKQVQHQINR